MGFFDEADVYVGALFYNALAVKTDNRVGRSHWAYHTFAPGVIE